MDGCHPRLRVNHKTNVGTATRQKINKPHNTDRTRPATSDRLFRTFHDGYAGLRTTLTLTSTNHTNVNLFVGRQRSFGHGFAAFTTCVGGHYSLDLSRELDREAAIRLSELSHLDQMCLR